jgi:predicted glycogen debranching enzyme
MVPNRFPDAGDEPEYNAVDASLWFVVTASELLERTALTNEVPAVDRRELEAAMDAIVTGYAAGTRYGIRIDEDGLLACGAPGVQLTWMDAKVGGVVVTPRIGKPVEVQALWINALTSAGRLDARWLALADRATASFNARFWNDARGCLYDVVDVDHVAGQVDASLRPNQVLAVGGLPVRLVKGDRARAIVTIVGEELLTPLGLRSLGPFEPGYRRLCDGSPADRDAAYHQGTAWPWLVGAYADAILATSADGAAARVAVKRLIEPLMKHLDEAGLDHVSEIADGEPPFTPRGCPFQAWSLGELIRTFDALDRRSTLDSP